MVSISNANDHLNDVLNGRVGCDQILLADWLMLVLMTSIDPNKEAAHLNVDISFGGTIYYLHHCVTQLKPPAETGPITEKVH